MARMIIVWGQVPGYDDVEGEPLHAFVEDYSLRRPAAYFDFALVDGIFLGLASAHIQPAKRPNADSDGFALLST